MNFTIYYLETVSYKCNSKVDLVKGASILSLVSCGEKVKGKS